MRISFQELVNTNSKEDIIQRYSDCIIKCIFLKETKEKMLIRNTSTTNLLFNSDNTPDNAHTGEVLFYFNGYLESGSNTFTGNYLSRAEQTWKDGLIPTSLFSFLFLEDTWPELGVINFDTQAIYLHRVVRKQYKRAYSENLIRKMALSFDESKILGIDNPYNTFTPSSLLSIFYPTYYYATAMLINDILRGKRLSGALSRKLFIKNVWWSPALYLGYKTTLIGEIQENTLHTMLPEVKLFKGNEGLKEQVNQWFRTVT